MKSELAVMSKLPSMPSVKAQWSIQQFWAFWQDRRSLPPTSTAPGPTKEMLRMMMFWQFFIVRTPELRYLSSLSSVISRMILRVLYSASSLTLRPLSKVLPVPLLVRIWGTPTASSKDLILSVIFQMVQMRALLMPITVLLLLVFTTLLDT